MMCGQSPLHHVFYHSSGSRCSHRNPAAQGRCSSFNLLPHYSMSTSCFYIHALWSCDRLCWSHGSQLRCLFQRNQLREHHTAKHLCHLPSLLLGHLLSRRSRTSRRTSTSHAVLPTPRRCRSVLSRPLLLTSRERWIRKRKTKKKHGVLSGIFKRKDKESK